MTENEEKPESEKTDEAKNTTREATPEDTMIEEALIEKKGEGMTPEAKTALIITGLSLISIILLNLTVHSNQENMTSLIISAVFAAVIGGLIVALIGVFVLLRKSEEIPFVMIGLLWLIFVLPFAFFLTPLSRYHNQNCLEKDKKIAEILKITVLKNCVEVRLPSEHAEENNYMKKVFSVYWENDVLTTWEDTTIPCREGDKYWHKVKLPLPEKKTNTADLFLIFKHPWENYETTKEISFPDPNSL